jgi:hypothetical protein
MVSVESVCGGLYPGNERRSERQYEDGANAEVEAVEDDGVAVFRVLSVMKVDN